jgi:peptidyl-dipeptidase Dcp
VDSGGPADFTNTVEALERAGSTLRRVAEAFYNRTGADSTESIQEIEKLVGPRVAGHEDDIYLNRRLFERLSQVSTEGLDAEAVRLVDEYRRRFVRAGAELDDAAQERLRDLNSQLSSSAPSSSSGCCATPMTPPCCSPA